MDETLELKPKQTEIWYLIWSFWAKNVKTGLYLLHYILIVYVHYFSIVLEKENKVSLCIVCIHHEDCSEFPQKFNNLHCRCCTRIL